MSETPDLLTETQFWLQITEDAARTIVCNPDLESRVRSHLDARGFGLWRVVATRVCLEDHLWIIDHNAIEASNNQVLLRRAGGEQ